MIKNKLLIIVIISLFGSILLNFTSASAKRSPDELVVAVNTFPRSLDPTFDANAQAQAWYRNIYEPLVIFDNTATMQPALAVSWKALDDFRWQVNLRKGVKFHNGDPFSAEDVKFTIERVLDPKTKAPWKPKITLIEKVEIVDEHSVVIHTKEPFATLMRNFTIIYILPSKLAREKGTEKFLEVPIGTGPWKFNSWLRDSYMTFTRNEDYWGKKPHISALTFKHMPEASTRMAALEAGEIDLMYALPPEHVERLKAKGYQIFSTFVGFSFVIELKSTMGGPLTDKRVRQAINYAVDKDSIVKNLFMGYARKLEGQVTGPDGFGYNPNVKAYPYDPKKAKELLKEAGYSQGFEVVLETASGQYPKDTEVSQLIAAQLLESMGIVVKVSVLERAIKTAKNYAGTSGPMFVICWQYLPAMDAELIYQYHITETYWNLMKSHEFDKMLEAAQREFDEKKRSEKLQKLAVWYNDFAPSLFLHQVVEVFASTPAVENFIFNKDFTLDLTNVSIKR
jgi:peptide/nickel transport system substrate-binding protein